MTTRSHVHEEVLSATPEEIFDLLVRPSAIRSWWSARCAVVVPKRDGVWTAAWGDDEDDPAWVCSARVVEFERPKRLVLGDYLYHARSGPLGFEADFETAFDVERAEGGASLRVTQSGFPLDPAVDGFLDACATGWRETFAGIRRHLAARR